MKKVFFIIICSLLFVSNVNCLNKVNYYKDQTTICDEEGNTAWVYKIYYNNRSLYFLNFSNNYNLNFEDYYEIDFEDSPYSKDLEKYVSKGIAGDSYYNRTLHVLLWESIYPDKKFDSCRNLVFDTEGLNHMKNTYLDVINFPLKEININKDEVYEIVYDGLKYYEIVESNNLDILIEESSLKIKGEPGKYNIIFKRKNSSAYEGSHLYTDGVNYLISSSSIPDTKYEVGVLIGYKNVSLYVKDSAGPLENACFIIDGNEHCSSQDGIITFMTNNDNYEIKPINLDSYDFTFHNNEIILKEKKKTNEVVQDENSSEVIEIPLEDTYAFPKEFIVIFIWFVKKKYI